MWWARAREARLRAVATDGHRLAKAEMPAPAGSAGMPGVIVPRKTVGEIQKLLEDPATEVAVSLSDTKIRLTIGDLVLTSKLIDGTFPDYERVIPKANDKVLTLDKADFERAVDRVSTISADRGRAVKLSLSDDKMVLAVNNPDSGSATDELAGRLRVGAARYRLQLQIPARHRRPADQRGGGVPPRRSGLADADPGFRRRRRDLCADADAGVTLRVGFMRTGRPPGELRRLHLEALGRRFFDRATRPLRPGLRELIMFGLKEGWACLFGGAMVALIILTGLLWPAGSPLSRYDALFLAALLLHACSGSQAGNAARGARHPDLPRRRDRDGAVQDGGRLWVYPDDAFFRIGGVPLFSGFLYASVGSYMARIMRFCISALRTTRRSGRPSSSPC